MIRGVLRLVVRVDTDAWAQTALKSDAPGIQNRISAEDSSEISANFKGHSAKLPKFLFNLAWLPFFSLEPEFLFALASSPLLLFSSSPKLPHLLLSSSPPSTPPPASRPYAAVSTTPLLHCNSKSYPKILLLFTNTPDLHLFFSKSPTAATNKTISSISSQIHKSLPLIFFPKSTPQSPNRRPSLARSAPLLRVFFTKAGHLLRRASDFSHHRFGGPPPPLASHNLQSRPSPLDPHTHSPHLHRRFLHAAELPAPASTDLEISVSSSAPRQAAGAPQQPPPTPSCRSRPFPCRRAKSPSRPRHRRPLLCRSSFVSPSEQSASFLGPIPLSGVPPRPPSSASLPLRPQAQLPPAHVFSPPAAAPPLHLLHGSASDSPSRPSLPLLHSSHVSGCTVLCSSLALPTPASPRLLPHPRAASSTTATISIDKISATISFSLLLSSPSNTVSCFLCDCLYRHSYALK